MPVLNFSSFFKFDDVKDNPIQLTIKKVAEEDVGPEKECKWVMRFKEDPRGVVLGPATNEQLIKIFDSDESDDWLDKKIELFGDTDVKFGGRKVGGVRFRAV